MGVHRVSHRTISLREAVRRIRRKSLKHVEAMIRTGRTPLLVEVAKWRVEQPEQWQRLLEATK